MKAMSLGVKSDSRVNVSFNLFLSSLSVKSPFSNENGLGYDFLMVFCLLIFFSTYSSTPGVGMITSGIMNN